MAEPEAVKAAIRFRNQLLNLEAGAARRMITLYRPVWESIRTDVDLLLAELEGKQMTLNQAIRLQRWQEIQRQLDAELTRFARLADGDVRLAQRGAIELSQSQARPLANLALPDGITLQTLSTAGIPFNTLPAGALESLAGIAGDGAPLGDLLAKLGPEVRGRVTGALSQTLVRGLSPRVGARMFRDEVGVGLTRALRITRTETLRAHREATRAQWAANPQIIKGYRRRAAQSDRTCFACIATDGQFYSIGKPLNEHVNGRCTLIPITVTYSDLGLPVRQPARRVTNARDWFNRQPVEVQRKMMGSQVHEAWTSGAFDLEDMGKIVPNQAWGEAVVQKPLAELVA